MAIVMLLLLLVPPFSVAIAVSRRFEAPGWAYPTGIAVGIALLFVLFLGFTFLMSFGMISGMHGIFPVSE